MPTEELAATKPRAAMVANMPCLRGNPRDRARKLAESLSEGRGQSRSLDTGDKEPRSAMQHHREHVLLHEREREVESAVAVEVGHCGLPIATGAVRKLMPEPAPSVAREHDEGIECNSGEVRSSVAVEVADQDLHEVVLLGQAPMLELSIGATKQQRGLVDRRAVGVPAGDKIVDAVVIEVAGSDEPSASVVAEQ